MLQNMRNLIKKHLPIFHSDSDLNIFLENMYGYLYRFLREIEILKKYYLHQCILKIKKKRNLMS